MQWMAGEDGHFLEEKTVTWFDLTVTWYNIIK